MPGRSRKTSTAEDLVDIVSHLPWWRCLALALVTFLIFHRIANAPLPTSSGKTGEFGSLLTSTWLRGLSLAGEYIAPILCVVAAALSFATCRKRTGLVDRVSASTNRSSLDDMTWAEFELLVGEAYRRQGEQVSERGGLSADGGVDLVLRKDGGEYLVQCTQWKAYTVGVDVVRQLKGVVSTHRARGGFVITSGQFTDDATAFARKANITLVDGVKLHAMIRGVRPTRVDPTGWDREEQAPIRSIPPSCPVCASTMIQRQARRGSMAGSAFWGCPKFPDCRGTKPMTSSASEPGLWVSSPSRSQPMRPPYCAYCHELTSGATMVGFADFSPLPDGVVGHPHGLEWFCEKHAKAARRYRHLPLDDALEKIGRAQRWWWPFG